MAYEFAKRGYNLALCARRIDKLRAIKADIHTLTPECYVVCRQLDVNDHESVATIFREFFSEFSHLDRIVINAGIGKGAAVSTGNTNTNLLLAKTNYLSALAQCEAAVEILREQNAGQLVTVSSVAAKRGLPRHLTVYASTKAALASLTEGIRAELIGTPIKITTLFPGYIHTEINDHIENMPFVITAEKAQPMLVDAIESEKPTCYVPKFPWVVSGFLLKNLPLSLVAKLA